MMVIFHGHSFEEGMDIGALVMLFHSPLGSYPPSQSRETITLFASPTTPLYIPFYCNANLEQLTTVSLFLGKRHQTVGVSCSTALCIACITIIACSRPALKCSRANTPRWRRGRGICSRCILYFVFGLWGGGGLVHLLRNIWPILDRGTQLICFECLLNTLWSTTLHSRMVKVDNTMSRVSSIFGQGEKTNIRRHLNICPTHV